MTTATYRYIPASNATHSVLVDFEGECLSYSAFAQIVVRRTKGGRFAVLNIMPKKDKTYSLILLTDTLDKARAYVASREP